MKAANTTPRPATVTSPPLCASNDGAPAVVTFAGLADALLVEELVFTVEDAIPVADAAPDPVAFDVVLEALPVPEAEVEAPAAADFADEASVVEPVAVASVAAVFPAFELEEDCQVVSY